MHVLGTAMKYFKIGMPIVFFFCIALITVGVATIDDEIIFSMLVFLDVFLAVMLVLSLANPYKAIVYDEENQALIVRGGRTFFTSFKRRVVYLSEIQQVYGIPNPFCSFSIDFNVGLHIVYGNKHMHIMTVSYPEIVAEKIRDILMARDRRLWEHANAARAQQNQNDGSQT
jgi:hypothetical protein